MCNLPQKYIFIDKKRTWSEAEDYCNAKYKTHSASFSTDQDYVIAVGMISSSRIWIGLNDIDAEGNWIWSDGSSWY